MSKLVIREVIDGYEIGYNMDNCMFIYKKDIVELTSRLINICEDGMNKNG